MGKIFCIMGKSGSGKDTILKVIKEEKSLKLKEIVAYTTRPKRNFETNGVEYFFIDKEILKKYEKLHKIIECREYNTIEGKWYYCTVDDGQIDLQKQNYIIIVTLEAYKSLQNYFGKDNIVPLYITLDDGERLSRVLKREMEQNSPNYEELCRRFLADSVDFSKTKLKDCNIEKFYINLEFESCINSIKEDIKIIISNK